MTDHPTIGTDSDDPDFVERLALALDAIERGEQPDLGAICKDRPDLLPELEAALEERDELPGLHRAASAFDPLVGTVVGGRYALRERIGSGGMGVVYRAEDVELRRAVALKMLRPELMSGEELEARLAREAEVLASVRHPGVVTVFDRGRTEDGRTYLVMTLLDGRSASELLEDAPQRRTAAGSRELGVDTAWIRDALGSDADLDANYVRQVVKWIATVARGLHVVHAAGVIHRDVKPSNIFVQSDGSPVLLDFGIVTLGPDITLANRDVALGTPAYMAPEQLDPRNPMTPAVDVYGLTATLYHLLTFERPYSGSPSQVLAALQRSDPVPAHRLRPGLPRDLQAILDKGMAREPRERYATAEALAADLEAWLDYRPVSARPVSTVARVWRRTRRTPVFKTLVAVALVAGIGVAGSAWWQAREAARADASWALCAKFPPSLVTAFPELRVPADDAANAAIESLLDELVALGNEASPSRVFRAGFYLDRGRFNEAAADMRAVAEEYETPTLVALADRYAGLADSGGKPADLTTDGLPEVRSAVDRFVLAFHLVREQDPDLTRAIDLLADADDATFGPAELRLLAQTRLPIRSMPRDERTAIYREVHDRAIRLEETRGRPFAIAAFAAGWALGGQVRFEEACVELERATELAPFDFVPWTNLGFVQLERIETERARSSLETALALQPDAVRAREKLAEAEWLDGNFDAADRIIADTPYPQDESGERRRAWMRGGVLLQRAVAAAGRADASDGSESTSVSFAEAAYHEFEAARDPENKSMSFQMVLALALATGDPRAVSALARAMVPEPLNVWRLFVLATVLPADLDAEASEAIRQLFHSQVREIAPDWTWASSDR